MTQVQGPAVLTERRGPVLVVTLNRPEARNAVNLDVHLGLGGALEAAEADQDIWVVVLTGAGDKAFCVGADLKALARGERLMPDDPARRAWGFAGAVRHAISKPIIAAVNGVAMGGGVELMLACDLVVAASGLEFALPEVKRGVIAAAGGIFRIVQQLPTKIALELLLTGASVGSERALELGLVNRVVPPEKVLATALMFAEQIVANAPLAVQSTKRLARGIAGGCFASEEQSWELNDREAAAIMRTEDAREGPRAFAEKRAPVWKAR